MTDQTVVELKPYVPSAKALKRIAKRQAIWDKSSNKERRVLVAKDVIRQVRKGMVKPGTGNFLDEWVPADMRFDSSLNGVSLRDSGLRDLALDNKVECSACALGALFMSCTLFNNKVNYGAYRSAAIGEAVRDAEFLPNGLNTVFDREQLILIEKAFEQGSGYFKTPVEQLRSRYFETDEQEQAAIEEAEKTLTPEERKAVAFGRLYWHKDSERLIAIMQNIVANGGEFKP